MSRSPRLRRQLARVVVVLCAVLPAGCSFLFDFPEEGSIAGGSGGGGGAAGCEPFAVEACDAQATEFATGCDAGARVCDEAGAFGACGCGPLAWAASFASATGTARGTSVAVAPDGRVLLAGLFTGSINVGGATLTAVGTDGADMFLASFSAAGEHQWSRSFGQTEDQIVPPVVAVDSAGAVVLAGGFRGTLNFGGDDLAAEAGGSMFVAKLDATGAHQWSHAYGENASVTSVAVGPGDGIALAGVFVGQLGVGAPGGGLLNLGETRETFVSRFTAAGDAIWINAQITGDFDDTGLFVGIGPADETIVGGYFMGDFTGSDELTLFAATPSAYAIRYDYDAENDDTTIAWSTRLQGSGSQTLTGFALTAEGDVVLAGHYKGSLEADSQPTLQTTDSSEDLFLVKLGNAEGDALLAESATESGDTLPSAVAIDASGAIIVVGSMNGAADFGGGNVSLAAGATDAAFIAKYDAAGAHLWSKAFSGADALVTFGDVAADPSSGQLAVGGDLLGAIDLGNGELTASDDVLLARFAP